MADLHMAAPDIALPLNATDQRSSAHFQEINQKYFAAMNSMFWQKFKEVAEEREKLGAKEKIMKYAQPNYRYAERKELQRDVA